MDLRKMNYDTDTLLDKFNLNVTQDCSVLNDWTTISGTLNAAEMEMLSQLRDDISLEVRSWNEEELKMHCISLMMYIAKIKQEGKVKVFYERTISAVVENERLSVKSDCLIASPKGVATPRAPYFFLNEYKKSKGEKVDPEGQMLTGMLIAQELNKDDKPLYGAWLEGKFWTFHVLNGKEYCASRSYDASKIEDLQGIVLILRRLKELILNR